MGFSMTDRPQQRENKCPGGGGMEGGRRSTSVQCNTMSVCVCVCVCVEMWLMWMVNCNLIKKKKKRAGRQALPIPTQGGMRFLSSRAKNNEYGLSACSLGHIPPHGLITSHLKKHLALSLSPEMSTQKRRFCKSHTARRDPAGSEPRFSDSLLHL